LKLLVFSSPICQPCRRQHAELDEIIDENPDIPIQFLDITDPQNEDLVKEHDVMAVPTLVLLKNNEVIKRKTGVLNASQLKEFMKG
jgi:thioredoxin 1